MKRVYKKPNIKELIMKDRLMDIITPGVSVDEFSKENTVGFEDEEDNDESMPSSISVWDD